MPQEKNENILIFLIDTFSEACVLSVKKNSI